MSVGILPVRCIGIQYTKQYPLQKSSKVKEPIDPSYHEWEKKILNTALHINSKYIYTTQVTSL